MSQLDLPGLRDRCLDDARAVLVRAVLGGRRPEPRLPGRWWAIPFGLACMACPVVLVVLALERYVSLLLQLGPGGAALWLCVLAAVTVLAADRGRRLLLRARAQGAGWARMGAGAGCLALVATAALLVPVAPTARAGWEGSGGRVWIADPVAWSQQLPAGSQVQLETPGAVVQPEAGSAVVGERGPDGSVRVGAITPVEGDVAIPARRYAAQHVRLRPGAPRQGVATVRLPSRPLGEAIADAWVGRPVRELVP
jgi:putative peptide zinc metalloprotease protein